MRKEAQRWPYGCLLLVAALAAVLALAPTVHASKGIVGSFEKPDGGSFRDVAVNQTGAGGVPPGTIYGGSYRQIDRFDPAFGFVERWGWDVIGVDEVQTVTIQAGGGTFKLSFGGFETPPIPYNAENSVVQTQLETLPSIGAGNVSVGGFYHPLSSCCNEFPNTGTVTFVNELTGTDMTDELVADGSELVDPTGINPVYIFTETRTDGGGGANIGYEICTDAPFCKDGQPGPTPAPNGVVSTSSGGYFGLAVDQSDGSVYALDRAYNRVQKFSATGEPLLVFGRDVNQTQSGTLAEVCTAASGDVCKQGTTGSAGGQLGSSTQSGLGIVPEGLPNAGNVLVADTNNRRVQEFDSEGNFVRAFGWDVVGPASADNIPGNEQQEVTVIGAGGTFTLTYANQTTAPIAYDAEASAVEVALEALSNITDVAVSGGPGDATGSNPYEITFEGTLADTDVAQITVNDMKLLTPIGMTLTCAGPTGGRGYEVGDPPPTIEYQWLRNSAPIAGATESEYETAAADAGKALQCQMFAFGEGPTAGGSTQVSVPIHVVDSALTGEAPGPPSSIPQLSWTNDFNTGQTRAVGAPGGLPISCSPGSWTGSPSFTYKWYRNGIPLTSNGANTSEYVRSTEDMATSASFQCAVTATNSGGSVTLVSPATGETFGSHGDSNNPEPEPLPSSTAEVTRLASVETTTTGANFEVCQTAAECRAGAAGQSVGQFESGAPDDVIIDDEGAIYAAETAVTSRVQKFTPQEAAPGLSPAIFGSPGAPTGSEGFSDAPQALAIGPDGNILVNKRWELPPAPPFCFNGLPAPEESRVQEIATDGTLVDTHLGCAHVPAHSDIRWISYKEDSDDILLGWGPQMMIVNEVNPLDLIVHEPTPTATSVTVSGLIDPHTDPYPNPPKTLFQVEYKKSDSSDWIPYLEPISLGAPDAVTPFTISVYPLEPNTEYDVRVVATKEYEGARTFSEPQSFTTHMATPEILALTATDVRADSAVLKATINPRGSETTYYFEYGTTADYGSRIPISPEAIGDGQGPVEVTQTLQGIEPKTYYFRVVAENESGIRASGRQTFNFYPPVCPNAQVRQQTGSAYLPECRAYEIASPANAGGVVLTTWSGSVTGLATNPSRVAFLASFGGIPGTGDPPATQEMYVATRTSTGWRTRYVGLSAKKAFQSGALPTSGNTEAARRSFSAVPTDPAMDRFVIWNWGYKEYVTRPNPYISFAPKVINANGEVVDSWLTDLPTWAGNEKFSSTQGRASVDLSHYVFVSDKPFVAGGLPEDIYDYDTEKRTVRIVSRDANGDPIEGSIVGVSRDGSHILMSSQAYAMPCTATVEIWGGRCREQVPATGFYMRSGETTYDVTEGHLAKYQGMSGDGSKVYFVSNQQITPDDTDTGQDLFMWSEETDSVTRVSAGVEGTGDTDVCNAINGWTPKCSINPISYYEQSCVTPAGCSPEPEFFHGYGRVGWSNDRGNGISDSFIAADSGDIYFFSPEQLTGDEGVSGRANLFLRRGGELRFVASFSVDPICQNSKPGSSFNAVICADSPIGRIQVSPNGRFAAFTSRAQLTGMDNAGKEAMYRYDVNADELLCVSCPQTGAAPEHDVYGSQNGLFMTHDGRAFFATRDAVVAQDTNEGLDIYEYVEGRPQLISNGLSPEYVGTEFGTSPFIREGLIGVSADGTDAYFATRSTLAPQDENGGNMKIYNARVNGGFPVSLTPPPCAAADECHGGSSQPPAPMIDGSSAHRGADGSNVADDGKTSASCARKAKRSKKLVRRSKALRKQINRAGGAKARLLKKRVRGAAKSARRAGKQAKQCRKQRRSHRNRKAGRRSHRNRKAGK